MMGDMVYVSKTCEEMNLGAGIPGFICWGDLRIETGVQRRARGWNLGS